MHANNRISIGTENFSEQVALDGQLSSKYSRRMFERAAKMLDLTLGVKALSAATTFRASWRLESVSLGQGFLTGVMAEFGGIELGIEFVVQSLENVAVEFAGDPGGVVVGCVQARGVFVQVNADKQAAIATDQLPDSSQEPRCTLRLQVAKR